MLLYIGRGQETRLWQKYIFIFLHRVFIFVSDRVSFPISKKIIIFAWTGVISIDIFVWEASFDLASEAIASSFNFILMKRTQLIFILPWIWDWFVISQFGPVAKTKISSPGAI
jgi:hypothetical protein